MENTIVFTLQLIGFIGILYGLGKSIRELIHGKFVYTTRILLSMMLIVSAIAYLFPAIRAFCFFFKCSPDFNISVVRYGIGIILALHGILWVIVYSTKDHDI